MIKVIVCDGHMLVRKGIAAIINTLEGFAAVAEAENGPLLFEYLRTSDGGADIVLMNMNLPLMEGLAVASKLSGLPFPPSIMVFSTDHHKERIQQMLNAGARGFLPRDCCEKMLETALRDLYHNGLHVNSYVTQQMIAAAKRTKQDTALTKKFNLTKKEEQLLPALCGDKPYKQIAKELYLSYKTVDNHCQNIYRKLNVSSRNQLASKVSQMGLVAAML